MPYFSYLKRLYLGTLGKFIPSDIFSSRHIISVKGICFIDDKVVLLKNERDEWDLPGGKLEKNEDINHCLLREMEEELSIEIVVEKLLAVTRLTVMDKIDVIIMVFSCSTAVDASQLKISHENYDLALFSMKDLTNIKLNTEYKKFILQAFHDN
jgi:8-oxo-dGTP pyrophosphatase MutT (NUDIX family)